MEGECSKSSCYKLDETDGSHGIGRIGEVDEAATLDHLTVSTFKMGSPIWSFDTLDTKMSKPLLRILNGFFGTSAT